MTHFNKIDIEQVVRSDDWMMQVLQAAEALQLPDWWIGAGFLRNKIWDALEGLESGRSRDVDLVYFNPDDTRPETDWRYDEYMKKKHPFAEWEVRNQARMHYVNNSEPYTSTADGISNWVETATCVAVRLKSDELEFLFCYGVEDLLNLIARPIEAFRTPGLLPVFHRRVAEKKWRERWPHLQVVEE